MLILASVRMVSEDLHGERLCSLVEKGILRKYEKIYFGLNTDPEALSQCKLSTSVEPPLSRHPGTRIHSHLRCVTSVVLLYYRDPARNLRARFKKYTSIEALKSLPRNWTASIYHLYCSVEYIGGLELSSGPNLLPNFCDPLGAYISSFQRFLYWALYCFVPTLDEPLQIFHGPRN